MGVGSLFLFPSVRFARDIFPKLLDFQVFLLEPLCIHGPQNQKKRSKYDLGFLYLFYKLGYTVTPKNGLKNGYYLFIFFTPISGGIGPYLKLLFGSHFEWIILDLWIKTIQMWRGLAANTSDTFSGDGDGRLHYQWKFFSLMFNIKLLFISLFDTYEIL